MLDERFARFRDRLTRVFDQIDALCEPIYTLSEGADTVLECADALEAAISTVVDRRYRLEEQICAIEERTGTF
jgi:hypothetical protein